MTLLGIIKGFIYFNNQKAHHGLRDLCGCTVAKQILLPVKTARKREGRLMLG